MGKRNNKSKIVVRKARKFENTNIIVAKDIVSMLMNLDPVTYKEMPCNSCSAAYIGETGRGVEKHLADLKNDTSADRISSSLVVHIDDYGHFPNWQGVQILHIGLDKRMRNFGSSIYL